MRLIVNMFSLYFAQVLPENGVVSITDEEAHHAISVMRTKVGEVVLLTDGRGEWAEGFVREISKKSFEVEISKRGFQPEVSPRLVVIQALTKSDRIKETLELLTEAGADRVIPWQAQRSISQWQPDHQNKWSATLRAATKQSRRFRIPEIGEPFDLAKANYFNSPNSKAILFHESATTKLSGLFKATPESAVDEIFIVIGPEGGITAAEQEGFLALGAQIAQMGEPVFRSAHAGVAALAAIQTLLGRW
jgi:16S rRNA (uracil1498-N3)-methyltransferase